MTANFFNIRRVADFGEAFTTYSSSEWDDETKVIYLLGRRPQVYFDKFSDPENALHSVFEKFVSDQGMSEVTQDAVAEAAASELATRIVTDELVDKLANHVADQIEANPGRDIDKVRTICPFPIDPNETGNEFAPALNALVAVRLAEHLPSVLEARNLPQIPVVSELDPQNFDPETTILNIVQNDRGSTSDPEEGKEGLVYSERLIRQPVYTGEVDKNAIYLPVDDFLVAQSTLAALMSYIQSNGGLTSNAVTGCQLFNGINVMAVKQETLDYLNVAIGDDLQDRENLQQLMGRVGLVIDFDNLEANTVSNVEMMFIAGVLADPDNPSHQAAFEKTIEAIGSSLEEASGNSPSDIFHAARMSVQQVAEHFASVLDVRNSLIDINHDRMTKLETSGNLTTLQMEA